MAEKDFVSEFVLKVEAEAAVIQATGVWPDPDREGQVLERLRGKYSELGINPGGERKIIRHARVVFPGGS